MWLIVGLVALLTGSAAIGVAAIVGSLAGVAIATVVVGWRRQLDGDSLGAVIELTIAAVLVAAVIAITAPVA